jgi:hypothetical protein
LAQIVIPSTVTYIGINCFNEIANVVYNGSYGDADETWGATVRNGVIDGGFVYASDDIEKATLLRYVGTDTMVTIPNTVTTIGYRSFAGHGNITNVTIPETVTSIDGSAFYNCSGIKSIDVPSSVEEIGWDAFSGVGNINYNGKADLYNEGLTWGAKTRNAVVVGDFLYKDATKTNLLKYVGHAKNVTVPSGVTTISAEAFYDCKDMASISIPASVDSIGKDAFHGCSGLEEGGVTFASIEQICYIKFAGDPQDDRDKSNPLSAAHKLYIDGKLITDLEIPSSVESIGQFAFKDSYLTSVSIPSSVKSIGQGAFRNCNQLTTVSIAEGLDSIAYKAFSECRNIKIRIPNSVTTICGNAFENCGSMRTVLIPSTVKTMGRTVFENSNATVLCEVSEQPDSWDENWNYWNDGSVIWGVVAANNGIVYAAIEDETGSARVVGYVGNAVESLVIPDSIKLGKTTCSVTTIGSGAFYNSEIVSIDVPESVDNIDDGAFGGGYDDNTGRYRSVVNINYSGSAGYDDSKWGAQNRNKVVLGDYVYQNDTHETITKYVGNSRVAAIPSGVKTIGHMLSNTQMWIR